MILLTHILLAVSSLGFTGYLYLNPTKSKFYTNYVLVVLTLFTGFFLVLHKPDHVAKTCVTGLVYLAFITFGTLSAKHKLIKQDAKHSLV